MCELIYKMYVTKLLENNVEITAVAVQYYHLIIALPQVKPLPNAAKTTLSPSLIFPSSHASVNAIGIEAAVVLP